MPLRIAVVTGSRADWGLLRPVVDALAEAGFTLRIVATGSHLDPRFGMTVDAMEANGYTVDVRVPINRSDDSALATAEAMGAAVSGLSVALDGLHCNMMLILGDLYEILAAALAATMMRVPVAHIAGGDVSEGAYDDAIRHAITKLSHLHFTTNAHSRRRVLQLGEASDRVYDVGSLGIDALRLIEHESRTSLETRLDFRFRARNLAITFHPATLDPTLPGDQIDPLLKALAGFGDDVGLVFTGANADDGGMQINERIRDFVSGRDNACFCVSLGQAGYYWLVRIADLVVGNSSSGMYEVPSLGTPTLDIGMRQQGRLKGPSVREVDNDADLIGAAVTSMLNAPPLDFTNPYGDGHSAERIVAALRAVGSPEQLLVKAFADLD